MVKIIKMEEIYLNGVAEVERQCFVAPWSEQVLLTELKNENAVMLCALDDGKVVGWAGMQYIFEGGYITNVAVSSYCRNCGIGEMLTQSLLTEVVRLKLEYVMLDVRESNISAINLYEKMGFIKLGIRRNFYEKPQENSWTMRKELYCSSFKT